MSAHNVFGVSCISALTVQSTTGVKSSQPTGASLVEETLQWLAADLPPDGVKIGMLANEATVLTVARFLSTLPASVPVVLDPVIRSSSGRELLEPEGVDALITHLLPRVHWVTPNLAELSRMCGLPVDIPEQMEAGAAMLRECHPHLGVVVTGGHLAEPNDLVVSPDSTSLWLSGHRIETRATHGTGCAFSTALLCGLVAGQDGIEAARSAKAFVSEAMRRAEPRGRGRGPMELLWPLRPVS